MCWDLGCSIYPQSFSLFCLMIYYTLCGQVLYIEKRSPNDSLFQYILINLKKLYIRHLQPKQLHG